MLARFLPDGTWQCDTAYEESVWGSKVIICYPDDRTEGVRFPGPIERAPNTSCWRIRLRIDVRGIGVSIDVIATTLEIAKNVAPLKLACEQPWFVWGCAGPSGTWETNGEELLW